MNEIRLTYYLGHASAPAFRVHEYLQRNPISNIREIAGDLELTYPTVASAMERMAKLEIASELTGYARNRMSTYAPYVELLNEGTELLE